MSCKQKVIQGTTVWLASRIETISGTPMQPGDAETISAIVVNTHTGETESLSVSSDNLHQLIMDDIRWQEDEAGYNFSFILPADKLPDANTFYRVVATLTDSSGSVVKVKWGEIETLSDWEDD